MRQFLTVVLVIAAIWAGLRFMNFAKSEVRKNEQADTSQRYAPGRLPGLPAELEAPLATAQGEGVAAFRRWLNTHRAEIGEPRLTEIELDFVVLTGRTDAGEARAVLDRLQRRIKSDHPQYKRFQQLDRAYARP